MVPVGLGVRRAHTATRVGRAAFLEVGVHASLLGGDATSGIVDQHVLEEVESLLVEVRAEGYRLVADPFGERGLKVGEAGLVLNARPFGFSGGTQQPGSVSNCVSSKRGRRGLLEDLEDFVNLRVAGKEWFAGTHLREDTANGPHINTGRVLAAPEEDLWRSVPQGDDFVSVGSKGNTEGASETEIRELEVSIAVDQQVLRLEITVENTMAVAVSDTFAQLAHELLHHRIAETQPSQVRPRAHGQRLASATIADRERLHVFLEIKVEELKHQVELVAICVDYVEESDNVRVVHLLEERDLADGSAGDSFIFCLETDLLERDDTIAVEEVLGLVDDAVGS